MYKEITECRICKNSNLKIVLSLGEQFLTGVFPKIKEEKITKGPLDLVWCNRCGLLQLKQSYSLEEMYGDNYGYRSGLNTSMVKHLQQKVSFLEKLVPLSETDLVIDIGSNDATTLKSYKKKHSKVGIDPTGKKFKEYYPEGIDLIPDFFSAEVFKKHFKERKAKIITSIAMFYDLEDPRKFVQDIESILDDNGVWHFEQSYMPSMLRTNAYDTICHEHLEFYSFKVIKNLIESCGLTVVDVQMNAVNGGSFAVTVCKAKANIVCNLPIINWLLSQEKNMGLDTEQPYLDFAKKVEQHRRDLKSLISSLVADGKKIIGYGASTKGNVLLQYCSIDSIEIPFIAEVNKEKFGSFTPGSLIPIISEAEAHDMRADYFLVLPWHFKHNILERENAYIVNGGKFIFPMPEIEII
ncbi:MAG: class I SAM-dependent methyltransferase [Bacteriovorax sp.]|nr:class I SAM-dependent methyltransferase [Bacteriovorax sp.]